MLGAVIIGLNLTRSFTGVGLLALVSELDTVLLALRIVVSSMTGYLVAVPLTLCPLRIHERPIDPDSTRAASRMLTASLSALIVKARDSGEMSSLLVCVSGR